MNNLSKEQIQRSKNIYKWYVSNKSGTTDIGFFKCDCGHECSAFIRKGFIGNDVISFPNVKYKDIRFADSENKIMDYCFECGAILENKFIRERNLKRKK